MVKRREYLGGLGTLAGLSLAGNAAADSTDVLTVDPRTTPADGYHPGPPRFIDVNQTIQTPLEGSSESSDGTEGEDRDNLAPRISDPERDPENYGADAFEWRVVDAPAESETELFFGDGEEYDAGTGNVAEFDPDVPGTYALELDAPDGTHRLTVRVFPAPPEDAGGPPRVTLAESHYDDETGEYVLEADAERAPNARHEGDLDVEFHADDRDALSDDEIRVDGHTARVPAGAVDGSARVHAVAVGDVHSVADAVRLDGRPRRSVTHLNASPEWAEDATIYEIFVHSFGGSEGATDFDLLASKADYLDDLGVDAVWLTPILEAHSFLQEDPPGGPHGYDVVDYFRTAESLRENGSFEAFVDACHERDIKVVFDLVINHTAREHPYYEAAEADGEASKYYDWYKRRADGEADYPYGWAGIPHLNFENVALREHLLAVVDRWSEVVDGFRCDLAWGVPHSFWKEVRARVKARDPEFLLLDETLDYDVDMAAGEFDMHYDPQLHGALKAAGSGGAAEGVIDAVSTRRDRGFPDHSLFLQYVENHDTARFRDDHSKAAQKTAAAATFTLPGTPMIYYGQERGLSEYGAVREGDPETDDDIEGTSRNFMNWDEYDADLLAFYRSLTAAREEVPALTQRASLEPAWFDSDSDDVVAFGRDATGLGERDHPGRGGENGRSRGHDRGNGEGHENGNGRGHEMHGDAGEERAMVVLNFGDEPAEVDLRSAVDTTDLISGEDVGVDRGGETTRVRVDSVAVLAADSLLGLGDEVLSIDDEAGDDRGPGSYTYPTGDAFADGAFDLTEVELYESADSYQLRFLLDGPVENPWELDGGFSVQQFQAYLRDPAADGGAIAAREGVNADFEEPYQYRVVADGENGCRVEAADGSEVATGRALASPALDSVFVEFPKGVVAADASELELAPLVLGYDPEDVGDVRRVNAAADAEHFGGGEGDAGEMGADPNVIDMATPPSVDQSDALAYGDETATLPYVDLSSAIFGERIARWEDSIGDDHGPGSYAYPTADAFYDGAFDLSAFEVYEDGDRLRFVCEQPAPVRNPWGLQRGFSHQFFQIYLRDPSADGGSTEGREGLLADFERPYQRRVVVAGEPGDTPLKQVEAPGEADPVSTDVNVSVVDSRNAVAIDVPKDAVGGAVEDLEIAPLLCPYDGFGWGGLREISADRGDYTIGGGSDDWIDPRVMDLVTPDGVSQSDALAYGADSRAEIPFLSL